MPIPAAGAAWPPATVSPIYVDYDEADAWYSGDKTRLSNLYGSRAASQRTRAEYARWLWAEGRDLARPDTRMHVPLAGDIASTSADLLFGEPPAITVADPKTQERLDAIIDEGGAHMRLLEAAEVGAGLGDVYLKVAWDQDVAKRPILAVEHGDAALPVFRWGRLVEVTFWKELERNGDAVVRLLEHHEPGSITYRVFEGTSRNLGAVVPLKDRPDTEYLVRVVDRDGRQATGIPEHLTATHWPNVRPNRKHRGQPYGRSDYAAPCYDQFDALDQTWTSWMRDIRLARARLIVPRGYLQSLGAGQGAEFDAEREVWAELDMDPLQAGGITINQFAIRVDEHQATAEAIIATAARSCGYSAQSFGLHGDGSDVTATEVSAKVQRSMTTRDKKIQYVTPALRRIVPAMLALDKALGWSTAQPLVPTVAFPPAVSQEPESVARTVQLLDAATAVSVDTKVRMVHPDWDDPKVAAEVQRIRDESGASTDPIEQMTDAARGAYDPVADPAGAPPAGE